MTSRVQKGGPIFRPTAKSRMRPTVGNNQQSSNTADSLSIPRNKEIPIPSQSSISPTPILSENTTLVPPINEASPQQNLDAPNISQSHPEALDPFLLSGRPPSMTNSRVPPHIVPSRNNTLDLPQRVNNSLPSLVSIINPSPLFPSLRSPPPPISQAPDLVRNGPEPSTSQIPLHVLHHSGTANVPVPSPNIIVNAVKPRRTASKRKASTTAPDSDVLERSDRGHEENIEKIVKRKKTVKDNNLDTVKHKAKRKKTKSAASGPEDSGNETGTIPNEQKRRSSSGTPRPRRSRAPSLPPFDPDADPGEDIDPTVVTMASLCVDTGQGRVSRKAAEILSNHAAWKAQNREKRARMKALMELKKYGRDEDGLDDNASKTNSLNASPQETSAPGPSSRITTSEGTLIVDDTGNGFDYSQDLATSRFNVQVRIGPNGETIIDEESLVVDRIEADDTENYTHVVESDHTKFVNSGSYGKKFRGSRWSAEETESFYDALSQYGENYELIAYVLPGRDRKSCKNKFKAEDKKNPARINYCLSNSIPVDMSTLSRMTGKDFSGPVPEIRAPTPQIEVEPIIPTQIQATPAPEVKSKRIKKKGLNDDGVIVVGDAGDFVPFPESP